MLCLRWRALVPSLLVLILGTCSLSRGADQQPAAPQAASSASPSATVLRATTRLVVVDVVATDSKGEPVLDLTADDFTVLEGGKPQKISGFSFKRGNKATAAPVGSSSGAFSNAPRFNNVTSMNVILLDGINGDFAGYAYGRDQLLKFLDTGTLTQPTALYALEQKLTLLHDFTTDTTELKALVQEFKPKGPVHVQDVYSAASPFSARKPSSSTTVNTMEATITGLNSLARALAGYPGRKNLIWVSAGFPITLFPEIIYDEANPFCHPSC